MSPRASIYTRLSTTSVLSSIFVAVSAFPISRIIDIWGRTKGFILMLFICTLGLILTAACTNVETYVFYGVGYSGLNFVISIIVADMTQPQNRMIAYGINSTPSIATTFAGPSIAESFLTLALGNGLLVLSPSFFLWSIPLAAIVSTNEKARRLGTIAPRAASGRTWAQSFIHYAIEVDAIGLFLIIIGFALVLLPFTLAASAINGWRNWLYYSHACSRCYPLPHFAAGRNGCVFESAYTYLHRLVHVHRTDRTGRFKWMGIAAVPVSTLATAYMIYFRHPGVLINWVVMRQLLIALSGGCLFMAEQVAVMAAVSHQEIAAVLALEGVFSDIGVSIGEAISGATWTNVLPKKLAEYLPEDQQANLAEIYGAAFRRLLIAGVCFMPIAFISVFWRDIELKKVHQTKGMIF
ncbi:hypothetical protein BT96DRAFT_1017053 [Gymnopus androsaceus JB14]|uniref:MFS general substrate transporter n=1 Tax=Gymnopus androsaceus JB14 TaxID=1447944 RepID=A0A6A4I3H5_9AGAR|nr:hypothetical protein BT96DRAFT_1017053 [Gymnopus androsaceus JB14]